LLISLAAAASSCAVAGATGESVIETGAELLDNPVGEDGVPEGEAGEADDVHAVTVSTKTATPSIVEARVLMQHSLAATCPIHAVTLLRQVHTWAVRTDLPSKRRRIVFATRTVGLAGLEPATSCTQSTRASQAALQPVSHEV
jgi:hypothetical protein